MQCLKYQPTPDLAPWLAQCWEWRLSKGRVIPEIYPGTGAELLFNLGAPLSVTSISQQDLSQHVTIDSGAAVVLCPRYSRLSFDAYGNTHLLALRLRSSACFDLFGVPLVQICDQVLGLDDLGIALPSSGELMEKGVKSLGPWLRQQLSLRPERDPALARAIERLYYGATGAELQQQLGMSTRTFQRQLRCYIGVDARYFLRTARFQRTLRLLLSGSPLLDTLLSQGYCDQSHFIKSCRFFTQQAPGQLLTQEHKNLNHYSPRVNKLVGFL